MEKILINDNRLTPTMSRTRSGRTQVFIEKKGNVEVSFSLEHEKRSMYAELIDEQWYWVEGCAECNGEPRDWLTYIECEEHDRCRCCGINRKDLKEAPWGGKHGWQCKPCADIEAAGIREDAFDKLNGEDPDCDYRDEIICPHCGSTLCSDELHESQDIECHVCEGEIYLEVEYTASYTTSVKGERITE